MGATVQVGADDDRSARNVHEGLPAVEPGLTGRRMDAPTAETPSDVARTCRATRTGARFPVGALLRRALLTRRDRLDAQTGVTEVVVAE